MTKATITKEAAKFVKLIIEDETLKDRRRITYESDVLQGSGRAAGTRLIAMAFHEDMPEFPWVAIIPLPRIRKAGEWLGFLHDEVNRLLAEQARVKLPSSTATPRRR